MLYGLVCHSLILAATTIDSFEPLVVSQESYFNGNSVQVSFPSPPTGSDDHYLTIRLPDKRLFAITELNKFVPIEETVIPPPWAGTGKMVIDIEVDVNIPRGTYRLAWVRLPAGTPFEWPPASYVRQSVFDIIEFGFGPSFDYIEDEGDEGEKPECEDDEGEKPEFEGAMQGVVTDAISGQPIEEAIVYNSCRKNHAVPTDEKGYYDLTSYSGLCELTAEAEGYQALTCQIVIPELVPLQRNLSLLPHGQNVPPLVPSQRVYHPGDILQVEFQATGLPPQSCLRYHFVIAYPDGRFFVLTDFNRFEAFNPPFLPHWIGTGNVVIDKPIDNDMPHGEYQLYILRMPEGIEEPLNHVERGKLNVGQFRIE